MQECEISGNQGPGILFRRAPRPTEVHSCLVEACDIEGNARVTGRGQIDILSHAHDLVIRKNRIEGQGARTVAGVYVSPAAERIWLSDNEISASWPEVVAQSSSLASHEPSITVGSAAVTEQDLLHLPPSARAKGR
jgi:hypothetical protein